MQSAVVNDDRQIVKDPLWDLMLSTNDCYPGCSCDSDFFDMNVARVQEWVKQNGEKKVQLALNQIDDLMITSNVEQISLQTNYNMENRKDVIDWMSQWYSLLVEASK